ncbi:hypothetical protein B0H67DRAFT_645134 [Lasiosphaeris hirsuta]|uniref:Uncharacterized protein n=1 Tax=Lasiosphaeris hirsuta TaxID=260670 RepID=A0AA40AGG3_9PEZI|nr:hypothetical protein B0H67DRAFT_645134 [Lasiosphaeris hirsuta]
MPIVFKILFVFIYPAILFIMEPGSVMVLLCWFAVVLAVLDKIHFLMHPGYWAGWFTLLIFLPPAFKRESPLMWNILGTILFASLWWLIGAANERSSLTGISPCDLCPLIWHSAGLDALENHQGEE